MAHPSGQADGDCPVNWIDTPLAGPSRTERGGGKPSADRGGSQKPGHRPAVLVGLTAVAVLFLVVARVDTAPSVGPVIEEDAADPEAMVGFSVDAGGQLLAGLATTERSGIGSELWVGGIDAPLERLISGVQGYAWHDTEPSLVAVVAPVPVEGGLRLFTVDLTDHPNRRIELIRGALEPLDWLRFWGDWGFVIGRGRNSSRFEVLGPDGETLVERSRGVPVGHDETAGLVVSPWHAGGRPVTVDLDDGSVQPMAGLTERQFISRMATGGIGGQIALHVSDADTGDDAILVLDEVGDLVARLPAAENVSTLRWIDNGTALAYGLGDSGAGTPLILFDPVTGRSRSLPLDPLDQSVQSRSISEAAARDRFHPRGP